jgi:hypothetical protein
MSRTLRRFEILLPLKFNDGSMVPGELTAQTILELREKFGAVSCETQTIKGVWQQAGQEYRDDLVRLFIDVPDLGEHRQYFVEYKEILKIRFQQIDIWMVTYPLDVI